MSGPGATVSTPGRGASTSQPWTLTWSPIEDIDISALPLYTAPVPPTSPASQNDPLVPGPGSESVAALLDNTSGISSAHPGATSASPFIGGTQTLTSAQTGGNTSSGSLFSSPALGGTTLTATQGGGTGGSPGNAASSNFATMLGSPPTASAFGGLGTLGNAGFATTSSTTNLSPMAGSSGATSIPKVGSTTSNREADGGWDLSWCKDPYWGEICAAVAGGSGIIKVSTTTSSQFDALIVRLSLSLLFFASDYTIPNWPTLSRRSFS